jgi:hypothetical protein
MSNRTAGVCFNPRTTLTFLIPLVLCCLAAFAQDGSQPTTSTFSCRATHVLGFEDAKSNASGTLSIQANSLQFQKEGKSAAQVKIASVQDVFLGEQSKQVGGLPMTLGKAAAPYGGGRVVSLFAHKKYDTITLEYVDSNGGFHGAMFQLSKGQGEVLKNALVANGAHVSDSPAQPKPQSTVEVSNESK